ncbi:hypothetical protein AB0K12_20755 [Nonomuraea sp. NPDC049419]|uniref:hypothetical protein n=1 Tax=Nonomuraea sp. NPDC049419 TaxID=3155772 RepID=UPI003417BB7E
MSADISAHVEVLRSDARALTACADRLRAIEADLEAGGGAPAWLHASVTAQVEACLAASADLENAARRLSRHADEAGP